MVDNKYSDRLESSKGKTLDLVSEAYVTEITGKINDYLLERVDSQENFEGLARIVGDFSRVAEGFVPEELFEGGEYNGVIPYEKIQVQYQREYLSLSDVFVDFKKQSGYNNRELSDRLKVSFRTFARLKKNEAPEGYPNDMGPRQVGADEEMKERILGAFEIDPPGKMDELSKLPFHHGYE